MKRDDKYPTKSIKHYFYDGNYKYDNGVKLEGYI